MKTRVEFEMKKNISINVSGGKSKANYTFLWALGEFLYLIIISQMG